MKKKYYLLLIVVLLGITSCQKYLDVKPYGLIIPKSPEEFSALIQTRLSNIEEGRDYSLVPKALTLLEWEFYGDNFEPLLAGPKVTFPIYIGDKIEKTTKELSDFNRLYEIIKDCNIVIGGMPEEDSDIARNTLGTAYAMRGVAYYQLVRLYCEPVGANPESQLGVPLAVEFNMEARLPRATLAESIAQVEADLKKALEYHVNEPDYLFTEDVAKGYLARSYFWTGEWAKARKISEEILAKYPLIDGDAYRSMFESSGKSGNTLLKVLYDVYGSGEQALLNQLQDYPLSNRFTSHFPVEERDNDIRYALSVGKKRMSTKPVFSGMRSAEMLLIAAESAYHLGDESSALKLINELRAHRITDVTPLTTTTLPKHNDQEIIVMDAEGKKLTPLLSLILSERRKELIMEGDRFFELKRNGRPVFSVFKDGKKYTVQRFMYTLPLPPSDLLLQDGLQQNPEYDKYTIGANNTPIK